MAIIKCPECGHEISDKAPVCPNCGVAIAGQITRCRNCGEVYFKSDNSCPHCHYDSRAFARVNKEAQPVSTDNESEQNRNNSEENVANVPPTPPVPPVTPKPTPATPPTPPINTTVSPDSQDNGNGNDIKPKKNRTTLYVVIAIIILAIAGICYYNMGNSQDNKEQEAYEYAMSSTDPSVLQSYLDTYTDADQAHRDSIQAHLQLLQQNDQDWANALVSGSKSALEDYLKSHPNSPHKQEIWNKIDTIDWNQALSTNTIESYQNYLDAHADGVFIDLAQDAIKKVKSKDVQPEEKQMVSGLFRRFFQSINTRNEGGLTATCEDVLSSFLGKSSATKSDVATFLNKIYKDDITNMNWYLNNDYNIKKREVGTDEYEYQVVFTARQNVDRKNAESSKTNFKINAKVSPDGKISSFNMVKVIE